MDKLIEERVNLWLNDDYDEATKQEIRNFLQNNPDELVEAFYRDLEFGTGGLRGIMGVGTNRMNKYTVGAATQGLANYLKKQFPGQDISVAVSFDSRNNSQYFADITADVLSANDITCHLFPALRPTPVLSFAVRHLHCQAGVMVTASHNPKEYNGYKVYWSDGGQLVPPHDKNTITEVNLVKTIHDIQWTRKAEKVHTIDSSLDAAYLNLVHGLSLHPEAIAAQKNLKIIYTPLHGTGITMVPKALEMYGFENVSIVKEQAVTDGNFPTVKSPNPEEKSALTLAIAQAEAEKADLVLATDPDADRVGIAIRNDKGEMILLNGNMTGSLLIHYLLSQWKELGKLNGSQFIVKTIVTTELIERMAFCFNVPCEDVLTGFKYIAEKIKEFEGKKTFIGGGEESYGYLAGDFVRDKDAVIACCLIAEMTAFYAAQGKSLYEMLIEIYHQYGFYKEELLSLTKQGKSGAEEIAQMMVNFRNNPPKEINGQKVLMMKDFQAGISYNFEKGTQEAITLPKSNVLQFFTADLSKITVRPSGTEPKIKFYFGVVGTLPNTSEYESTNALLAEKIQSIIKDLGL
ncbi:MAG: phospho-sugar mutase [Paludibacteraceae bacterium]|nr:phospho-sugar mutase [Paludibacteraceae bacterium]